MGSSMVDQVKNRSTHETCVLPVIKGNIQFILFALCSLCNKNNLQGIPFNI